MARAVRRETEIIPAHEETVVHFDRTCDVCGKAIDPYGEEPDFANELYIMYNPDQCVNSGFRRDYCTEHLTPIYEAICKLINADPGQDGYDYDSLEG